MKGLLTFATDLRNLYRVPFTAWVAVVFLTDTVLCNLLILPLLKTGNGACRRFGWWYVKRVWSRVIVHGALVRLRIEGRENIPRSQPYIGVSNHQGIPENFFYHSHLPQDMVYVTKKEWKKHPLGFLMVPIMERLHNPFIDRQNTAQALRELEVSLDLALREGSSVIWFAEGTRTKDERIAGFRKGAFIEAIKRGVPVVPLAIDGCQRFQQPDTYLLNPFTRIRVKIGEPIATTGLNLADAEALLRRTRDAMLQLHREIGGAGGDADEVLAVSRKSA